MSNSFTTRREVLRASLAGAAGLATGVSFTAAAHAQGANPQGALAGNIRHSVARWTYDFLSLDELCTLVQETGFSAIDLVGSEDWPTLAANGIDCSMCNGAELNLTDGWADPQFHPALIERYRAHIDLVADPGYVHLICFSGNRRDMDPEDGLRAAEAGLKEIIGQAEERSVMLHMELLNSKVNHPDYLCDNTAWGIELCRRIGSPNFKLLYDIYHMQISEGDIIRTIRDNHEYFGHYHTAGNPGRNEIDNTQELNYPAICRAIVETGFTGYVAQEFIPRDKTPDAAAASLRQAIEICDV